MKFVFLFLVSLLFPFLVRSQTPEDSVKNTVRKLELHLNITSTLSNALGNANNSGLLLDPYLIGIKYQVKKRIFLRSGFNIKTKASTENFGQRNVAESDYKLRLGLERRMPATSKFIVYEGIDAVGGYFSSDVSTSDFTNPATTQIKSNQSSYGGGLVLGFIYKLNKRIYFSTEASIYLQLTNSYKYLSLGFPDPTPIESRTYGYILTPVIPSSLYVSINF